MKLLFLTHILYYISSIGALRLEVLEELKELHEMWAGMMWCDVVWLYGVSEWIVVVSL